MLGCVFSKQSPKIGTKLAVVEVGKKVRLLGVQGSTKVEALVARVVGKINKISLELQNHISLKKLKYRNGRKHMREGEGEEVHKDGFQVAEIRFLQRQIYPRYYLCLKCSSH